MDTIVERCCGLDVHQSVVVACVLIGAPGKRPHRQVRSFRAMSAELAELRAWLNDQGVTVCSVKISASPSALPTGSAEDSASSL